MTRIWLVPFLLTATLGAGCGRRDAAAPKKQPGLGELAYCTSDAECADGYYCSGGTCQPGCVRDTDCAATQFCDSGSCADRNGANRTCSSHENCNVGDFCNLATGQCVECLNDDHCELGLSCRADGTCGEDTGCSNNFDCGALVCQTETGTCVQCLSSADCPTGQTCRENACFTQSTSGQTPCTSQSQCDVFGRICDTSAGTCRPCQDNAECGTGRMCSAGTCTYDPGSGGGGGGGSGDGSCTAHADCGGIACFLGACLPCFADFMCVDMNSIFGGETLICDVYSGGCVVPECTSALDCPAGDGCYTGHCGPCLYDDECRPGELCDPASGICGAASGGTGGGGTGGGGGGGSTTPGALGASCSTKSDCSGDLVCLTGAAGGVCTRECIGSGNGGDADCPSGWACENFESGALDGLQLCNSSANADASMPGQPFTQAPGASCASGNACQTGVCFDGALECARGCLANRDCGAGEVCYAVWDAYGPLGQHFCYGSDTVTYLPAGASCASGSECDSGVCAGTCDDGSACNDSLDCASGVCSGLCVDHCRSNADCGGGDACASWPMLTGFDYSGFVPVCLPKLYSGSAANGAACTSDADCASDWCVGGICTTMCGIDADCGVVSGSTCTPLTFVDASNAPIYSAAFCQ